MNAPVPPRSARRCSARRAPARGSARGSAPGSAGRDSAYRGSAAWEIANYHPDRFGDLLRLLGEMARADGQEPETEEDLRGRLNLPNWVPLRDIWLAGPASRPAPGPAPGPASVRGRATVLPSGLCGWVGFLTFEEKVRGEAGTSAWLHGGVHPAWRGRGLGRILLDLALEELRRRHGPDLRTVNTSVNAAFPERGYFLEGRGFTRNQVMHRLRWTPDRAGALPVPAVPPGFAVRSVTEARDPPGAREGGAGGGWGPVRLEDLAAAYTSGYAGHPVPFALTAEEVRQTLAAPDFAPGASFHVWRGPCLVGFVVSLLPSPDSGTLLYLGVLEEHRRKGLGHTLVRLACEAMAAQGAEAVDVTVVGDNEPALRTYRKAGFEPFESRVTYELEPAWRA